MGLCSLLLCRVVGILLNRQAPGVDGADVLGSYFYSVSLAVSVTPLHTVNRAHTSDLEPFPALWQWSCLLLKAQEPLHEYFGRKRQRLCG